VRETPALKLTEFAMNKAGVSPAVLTRLSTGKEALPPIRLCGCLSIFEIPHHFGSGCKWIMISILQKTRWLQKLTKKSINGLLHKKLSEPSELTGHTRRSFQTFNKKAPVPKFGNGDY